MIFFKSGGAGAGRVSELFIPRYKRLRPGCAHFALPLLAGTNCGMWPRAGGAEPVMLFKFPVIDLGESRRDKDGWIRRFIGELNAGAAAAAVWGGPFIDVGESPGGGAFAPCSSFAKP